MLPLLGIAIVVVGFALRINPLAVVVAAAITTGLAAHHGLVDVISAFGKGFVDSRSVAVVWLALPVIGLLESAGLKERARIVISRIHAATVGRLLLAYLAVRQITAALGLVSLGGHAQMVRPLISPMSEAAAENRVGALSERTRFRIRAHAAAVDNIGVFFGEDIFIAIGSILSTALLIGPAATAVRLTRRPGLAMLWAALLGLLAMWLGVLLSYDSYTWPPAHHGWPVSFLVVAVVVVTYLVADLGSGLLRSRRRTRPVETVG